ncbi:MAG TPA: hypothetical protein VK147_11170, partial [Candidatus Didemnitutus sp.]|nr:hypothetical protein [Candidatus Didemnitutus sp.]
ECFTSEFHAIYAPSRFSWWRRGRTSQMKRCHVFPAQHHIDNGCLVGAWYIRSRNDEWSSTIRWINFRR